MLVVVVSSHEAEPIARHTIAMQASAAVVACAVLAVVLLWRRCSRQLAAVIAGAMALGAVSAGVQITALTADPVGSWVSNRATATVTGIVTSDAIQRTRSSAAIWQAATTTEIRIATSAVVARGEPVLVDVPMAVRIPGDAAVPPAGSLVVVSGRLAKARDPSLAAMLHPDRGITVLEPPKPIDSVANAMRSGLREAVRGAPPDAAALVAGLAVGDESLQSPELDDAMRASGLSHLTAVSGGNVAIVLVVVLALARLLRLRMPARMTLSLIALAGFVILVRPQPSVVRAAVMGVVMILALATGGRRSGPSVLGTAVLLLVVLSPMLAATWAFALSVFATAGLIVVAPVILRAFQRGRITSRWPPALVEALAVTMAAQVATIPLLVAMGASFGWVAIPANLLAMPAVAPVTILGLLAAILGPLAPTPAAWLGHLAAWPASWIAGVAHACSDLPFVAFPWPSGTVGVLLLAASAVGIWAARSRLRARYPDGVPPDVIALVCGPLCVALALWGVAPPGSRGWPPPGWLMVACDIGQGDAIVLRAAERSAIVVDTGPDARALIRCLRELGVIEVAAVILTHFHADHVNGLRGLLDEYAIGAVYATPVEDPPEEVANTHAWLAARSMPASVVRVGDQLQAGDVRWRILWPSRIVRRGSIANNGSVVMLVEIAGTSVLLPGDIEVEAQNALMAAEPSLRVDVMKIPHHGSRNQSARLPSWSGARVALISCGEGNTYGHPHPDTMLAWEQAGALLGRTDTDGDLAVVRSDDGRLGLVTRGGW